MFKKILAFVMAMVLVFSLVPAVAAAESEVRFDFGANGNAAHVDGKEISAGKTFTEGGYQLVLTDCSKVYDGAFDLKGNSCLKMGTGKLNGTFTFAVPEDVNEVVIYAAKYKANNSKLSVNGTEHTLSKASNDGAYDEIVVDTSATKSVSVATVGTTYRAMIDAIVFKGFSGSGSTTPVEPEVTEPEVTEPEVTEPEVTEPPVVPTDPVEIVKAAYALEPGASLSYKATLTGKIISVKTAYDSNYNNITVVIAVEGCEDMPITCYRLKGNGADQINLGDTITVSGYITNYQHTSGACEVEFAVGCTLDSWIAAGSTEPEVTEPEVTEPSVTPTEPEVTEPSVAPTTPSEVLNTLKTGDQVVIFAPAYNKALSADKVTASSYYNKGVDVTVANGAVSGYGDAEIWTVTDNGDGTYSFANGGQNIGLADSFSSMNLGAIHDDWQLISLGGSLYNLKNVGRGNFMEWYASKDNWSTYNSTKAATDDQFQLSFYVVGVGILGAEVEPSEPEVTEPTEPEVTEPTEPEVTEPSVAPTEPEVTEPSVAPTEPEVTEPSVEPTEPVVSASATYIMSDYVISGELGGGAPIRDLDENVQMAISSGWFTTQARVYKNGNAVISSKVAMDSIVLNVSSNKEEVSTFPVSVSEDGETWVVFDAAVPYVKAYTDVTFDLPAGCKFVKLEATNNQIRIMQMTVNFEASQGEEPTEPTEPEVTEPSVEPTEPSVAPTEPEVTEPSVAPTEPSVPTVPDDNAPVAGKAYKFGMIQEKVSATDVYYLVGGMSGYYMATANNAEQAIDVYLEETAGGYYLYTMSGEDKLYINMVLSADGAHVNGAYEAAASTVYTYNAEMETIVASINNGVYRFGTRNDKTYTTVGPVDVEKGNFYCKFYAIDTEVEPTEPTEPEVTEPTTPVEPSELTIAEAIELGKAQGTDNYTTDKYKVTGVITDVYQTTYGNMKLTDENGNIFTIYGTFNEDGTVRYDALEVKPVAGDTVTVYGIIGNYKDDPQMKNGWIVAHIPGIPEETDPSEKLDAELSFADVANRTSITTEQQVWQQNGITFTNDKAGSKTNVADYKNPVRLYQNSKITIAAEDMIKIVVVCNGEKDYATALVESITAAEGVTVTKDGKIVTIEFAEAVDSFVVESLTAQVRVDSIGVYFADGEEEGVVGDMTGDSEVNNDDVVLLLWHTLFPEDYPLTVDADLNKDGSVNNDDVVLLLWHTLFPEDYPL